MKKYKYKILVKNLIQNKDYTLEELNKFGEDGYKIIKFKFDSMGNELIILEKEWYDFT